MKSYTALGELSQAADAASLRTGRRFCSSQAPDFSLSTASFCTSNASAKMDNLLSRDNDSSVSSLLSLPPELLLRILEYAPPASLQQLRASSKNLQALADPLLWHTIHLYPHLDRFRQVLDLSMHPPVRNHVRRIVYDLRWAPVVDRIIKRIQTVFSARVTALERDSALREAQHVRMGTLEPSRDDDIELLFLHDILRNLTSLESIVVQENNRSHSTSNSIDIDSLPPYYQKIRERTCGALVDSDLEPGIYCFRASTRSTKRLIMATHSLLKRIRNFEIYNAHWDHVTAFEPTGKHLLLLSDFISGLKALTLHASFSSDVSPRFLLTNLGTVLSLASGLEILDLSFGVTRESDPFDDEWSSDEDGQAAESVMDNQSVLEIIKRGYRGHPNLGHGLKRLTFTELRSCQSDLLEVLKRGASTLKTLELNHIELLPERERLPFCPPISQRQMPCLVDMLRKIRSLLSLDKIWFSRRFRNFGRQEWDLYPEAIYDESPAYAEMPGPRPLLLEQIFQWVLGAERCPIEELAIKAGNLDISGDQSAASDRLMDSSFIVRKDWYFDHPGDIDSQISGLSPSQDASSSGIDVSSLLPYESPSSGSGTSTIGPSSPIFYPDPMADEP